MTTKKRITAALRGNWNYVGEAEMLKAALDSAVVNIMMADHDGIIRYMNKAAESLMQRSDNHLRKALPHFRADNIIGRNFDIFHVNSSHVRQLIANLNDTHETQISVGELVFRLSASPILGARGERLGTVLEWLDRTSEVKSIRNVLTVIDAATGNGDFSNRVDSTGMEGFYKQVADGMNRLVDDVNALVTDAALLVDAAVEGKLATRADAGRHRGDFRKIVQGVNDTLDAVIGPLNVAAGYVDRISNGDIPPKITDHYNGDFNLIKNNLNKAIDAVNALVADANQLSVAAVEGKLAARAGIRAISGGSCRASTTRWTR